MYVCGLKQVLSLALILTSVVFVNAHKRGLNDALGAYILQLSGNTPICVSSCLASCKQGNKTDDTCEWTSTLLSHLESISNNTMSMKESLTKMLISESGREDILLKQKFEKFEKNLTSEIDIQEKKLKQKFNCADLLADGDNISGVRTVYPYKCCPSRPVEVYCDQTTEGGGWTKIQRRTNLPVRENFYRDWSAYSSGFGNIIGEFWLGLDNIYQLTNHLTMELRIDLEDYENEKKYAKYMTFRIEDSLTNYKLHLGPFEGNLIDDFETDHDQRSFSTFDKDNDDYPSVNCAKERKGGWWFGSCGWVSLNGLPLVGKHDSAGIIWLSWHEYYHSLKETTMMIRPTI